MFTAEELEALHRVNVDLKRINSCWTITEDLKIIFQAVKTREADLRWRDDPRASVTRADKLAEIEREISG